MKILIDARLYGLENAGLGRYAAALIQELSNLDSQNDYVVLLRKKYFDSLTLPKNWHKVEAEFRHYSPREQVEIPKIIKRYKPDFTHFLHFNVPLLVSDPFVVTIHDIIKHKSQGKETTTLPYFVYLVKRIGYKAVFRKAVVSSAKIIVPTRFVKKDLLKRYQIDKNKVAVIYEGVSKPKFSASKKSLLEKYSLTSGYFIYTGNAYPHKNLDRAIEAIVKLNEDRKAKVILAIASARNVFTKRFEEKIKKYKAAGFVKLLGFVEDRELNVLYVNSLGFLYPSLYEGFGLPGLEAMAAGTIALVSEIPVFREVYQDSAVYFNPFDFTAIAQAMKVVLEMDPKKRKKMILEGKKFVKRYSWQKMAKETLKVYDASVK